MEEKRKLTGAFLLAEKNTWLPQSRNVSTFWLANKDVEKNKIIILLKQ